MKCSPATVLSNVMIIIECEWIVTKTYLVHVILLGERWRRDYRNRSSLRKTRLPFSCHLQLATTLIPSYISTDSIERKRCIRSCSLMSWGNKGFDYWICFFVKVAVESHKAGNMASASSIDYQRQHIYAIVKKRSKVELECITIRTQCK